MMIIAVSGFLFGPPCICLQFVVITCGDDESSRCQLHVNAAVTRSALLALFHLIHRSFTSSATLVRKNCGRGFSFSKHMLHVFNYHCTSHCIRKLVKYAVQFQPSLSPTVLASPAVQ